MERRVVIDPREMVELAIANVITSLLIGRKSKSDDDFFLQIRELHYLVDHYVASLDNAWEIDLFPWLRYLNTKNFQKLNECKMLTFDIIKELKEEYKQGRLKGIVHDLFHESEQTGKDGLTDDQIRMAVTDIIAAGMLTSSTSLYSFLSIIAKHQSVQDKVISEINAVLNKHEVSDIMLNHREEMPYTQACFLELQRYVSIGPFGVPHAALASTDIQGYRVDRGDWIFINLWFLHHRESYWNQPWEFIPERFLDESGELLPADHINRKRVLAFGAGTRACIGQVLARSRLFILGTKLIKEFKIEKEVDDDAHDPRNFKFAAVVFPCSQKLIFTPRLK